MLMTLHSGCDLGSASTVFPGKMIMRMANASDSRLVAAASFYLPTPPFIHTAFANCWRDYDWNDFPTANQEEKR